MPGNPHARRFAPWKSLGAAAILGVAVAALLLVGNPSQEAGAASLKPEAKAGFQTVDKLVLTISLPGAPGRNARLTPRRSP